MPRLKALPPAKIGGIKIAIRNKRNVCNMTGNDCVGIRHMVMGGRRFLVPHKLTRQLCVMRVSILVSERSCCESSAMKMTAFENNKEADWCGVSIQLV